MGDANELEAGCRKAVEELNAAINTFWQAALGGAVMALDRHIPAGDRAVALRHHAPAEQPVCLRHRWLTGSCLVPALPTATDWC